MKKKELIAVWAEVLRYVWEAIGMDTIAANGYNAMTRDEVFETCCDASFDVYSGLTHDEIDEFRNRNRDWDEELKTAAFGDHELFGM